MKKKYFVFLFTTLVAISAASASMSVAWFASSDLLRIEGINIEIETAKELFISTKIEEEWTKNHISYDECKKVSFFEPCSAMMSDKWIETKAQMPQFIDSYNSYYNKIDSSEGNTYVVPTEEIKDGGYYSQEFFLYSEYPYLAVVNSEKTYIKPNVDSNMKEAEKIAKETGRDKNTIYEELNSIVNSLRYSVLVTTESKYDYKIIDPNKEGTTVYGGLMDSDLSGMYDVTTDYTNNTKYEALYGEVNDRSLIEYRDEPIQGQIIGKHTWYNSEHDITAKQIDFDKSKANGLTLKEEEALSLEEYNDIKERLLYGKATKEEISKLLLIPVEAYVPTRIVISLYLEGWDKDNINDTMAASFVSGLGFGVIDRNIVK